MFKVSGNTVWFKALFYMELLIIDYDIANYVYENTSNATRKI